MPDGSEFQTERPAMLKPREAKVVHSTLPLITTATGKFTTLLCLIVNQCSVCDATKLSDFPVCLL